MKKGARHRLTRVRRTRNGYVQIVVSEAHAKMMIIMMMNARGAVGSSKKELKMAAVRLAVVADISNCTRYQLSVSWGARTQEEMIAKAAADKMICWSRTLIQSRPKVAPSPVGASKSCWKMSPRGARVAPADHNIGRGGRLAELRLDCQDY